MKIIPLYGNFLELARRKIGISASLGIGTALSLPLLSLLAKTMQSPKPSRPLGVALVGLGKYSREELAPALQETKNCRLTGIVTGSPDKAQEWMKKYQLPQKNVYTYDTFDQLKDNPDIDIVYVVLPNSLHAEYSIRASRAGKHVICEKPMALSVQECQDMIAAAKAAGKMLSIGYRLHFEPHHQEVMRLGQEKGFGPVKLVENSFGFKIGDPSQLRLKKDLAGGGALQDVGIYAINAARYVTGEEPVAVTAQEYKTDPDKFPDVDETITFQLQFPSGAVANCSTTYACDTERLFASAEKGWFELRPAYNYTGLTGKTSEGDLSFPPVNHQAAQMDDFAACILHHKPTRVPGEEGLKDVRIIQTIYKAVETGGEERIDHE
ncbi:Gfo/Idh/MocA family oxidoreductase [soil metagenome]